MAPYQIALVVALIIPCAAWIGHTPASAAMRDAIVRACRLAGMSQKELAIEMGLTPEQLSVQLAGREPLNAWRLYGMTSPDFRRELLAQQVNQLADAGATVITNARLDTLLSRLDLLLDDHTKTAQKMTLPQTFKRETA